MKKKVFIALGVCIFLGLKECGITKQYNSEQILAKDEDIVDEDYYVEICNKYLEENLRDELQTITNFDNPDVTVLEKMPENYCEILDAGSSDKYYKVVFTTMQDDLLGPIEFFLNKEGSIVGLSFRE